MGGAADAVEVGLAKLLVDHVVGGRADDLGAVPVVLSVGLCLLAITSATLAALVAVAVVLIALAHGAGEDRRREAKDEEVSPHGGGGRLECSEKIEMTAIRPG